MIRLIRNTLVLVVALALFANCATASTLERIVDSGQFRVGMSGAQPPFNMKDRTGEVIGYEADLATMIANAMDVELVIVERPFGQLMDALLAGEVDVILSGMTMTPKRNLRAAFVGPYIVSGKSLLTRDATIARIDDMSDVDTAGLTVVTLAGSTSQDFTEEYLPNAKLQTVDNYEKGVRMVLDDQVDLMIADYPICALSVLRYRDQGLISLSSPLTIEPIGIAVRQGDSLLLNFLENYLGALEMLGVLVELESFWFENPAWLDQIP